MIIEKLESMPTDTLKNLFIMYFIIFAFVSGILLKDYFEPIDREVYLYSNFVFVISAFLSILFGKLYFKKLVNEK